MIDRHAASNRGRIVAALRELVEALDRRVPHVERLGEVRIAREAEALRRQALARIEQLTTAQANADGPATDRAEAVMADDGGPLPATEWRISA